MKTQEKHVNDIQVGDTVKIEDKLITVSRSNMPKTSSDGDITFEGMNSIFFKAAGWSTKANYLAVVSSWKA
jgi:hypothetical protein